jgi:hypothetical protein
MCVESNQDCITIDQARKVVARAEEATAEMSRVARDSWAREQEAVVVYVSGQPSKLWIALAKLLGFRLQENE